MALYKHPFVVQPSQVKPYLIQSKIELRQLIAHPGIVKSMKLKRIIIKFIIIIRGKWNTNLQTTLNRTDKNQTIKPVTVINLLEAKKLQ